MSRFYMSSENSRGNQVTAAGSSRGQRTHARGWHLGIIVDAHDEQGEDVFTLYASGGSNDPQGRAIGTLKLVDGKPVLLVPQFGIEYIDEHKVSAWMPR